MLETTEEILFSIARIIYEKKGMNILALDVRGISSITDYVIIAEGNVDRHITSIAQGVSKQMKEVGTRTLRVEGVNSGDWVVLDYGEIMVHLFSSGLREKYSLERLWPESKIVALPTEIFEKYTT